MSPVPRLATAAGLIVLGLAATPAVASPLARAETSGPAVTVEAGRYDWGQGLTLAYYLPLSLPRAAHRPPGTPGGSAAPGGLPLFVGADLGVGVTGTDRHGLGLGARGFVGYGHTHRALLTAGFAVVARDTLWLHGSVAADRSYWGPELAAGYERVGARGLLLRLLAGVTYARRLEASFSDHLRPTVSLALGWKAW